MLGRVYWANILSVAVALPVLRTVLHCGVLVVGMAYPVLVLLLLCWRDTVTSVFYCTGGIQWQCSNHCWMLMEDLHKDKYRFWTGMTLSVRLIVTVAFFFISPIVNVCITAIVIGILLLWSCTDCVYKNIYLSTLEAFYLLNIILLSIVSLFASFLKSKEYQIATIVSVCLSFVVFLVTMAMHLWWNFNLKKIKRRLGFKDRPEYTRVPQVAANDEDRPPPGSPPSIVYGSRRGEHQFVQFPRDHEELESLYQAIPELKLILDFHAVFQISFDS